ncbi:DUF3159 domain-containing protein [Mycolicibacterium bacteremicum]|uniref:DUF3159 domain-containing protein n=1 Tax=Mycolicibacterium bacteremicum TaxID=564198 RepID=UPI0026EF9255|nr:DUF3159 domain-containing protein [Mycolicibacterium bacteremicum]
MTNAPLDGLLERAGGVRGLIYSGLPVSVYAVTSAVAGRIPAVIAAVSAAALVFGWQLVKRESLRPALWGFLGVAACAGLALFTGEAKDFYLPGIWIALAVAITLTASIAIRRPLVGVVWAWVTGRDDAWRRVPRVRLAFDLVTAVMAIVSWSRFVVQNHLYASNEAELLAVARLAMGWPLFLVTSAALVFAVRYAIRTLPRSAG